MDRSVGCGGRTFNSSTTIERLATKANREDDTTKKTAGVNKNSPKIVHA